MRRLFKNLLQHRRQIGGKFSKLMKFKKLLENWKFKTFLKKKKPDELSKTSEASFQCGKRNPKGIGFSITGNIDNEAEYGGN